MDTEARAVLSTTTNTMTVIVRIIGLILLVIGMVVSLVVIAEAWKLYTQPARIEPFARAIEHGSNLDAALVARRPEAVSDTVKEVREDAGFGTEQHSVQAGQAAPASAPPPFRLSYFVAWFLAILMLLLVGRLAIAAVKTGGELALYDLQLRNFARQMVKEALRARQSE